MRAEMDAIKIESRQEIRDVCKALVEWQDEHKENENVQKMIRFLLGETFRYIV